MTTILMFCLAFLQFLLYQEVRKKFPNLTCDIGTQGKVLQSFSLDESLIKYFHVWSLSLIYLQLRVKKNSEKVDVENYKEQINQ